jgi:hypothetical protein
LLEPACGEGAFLIPAVKRLMQVLDRSKGELSDLKSAIRAFDIDSSHVTSTKRSLVSLITSYGHGIDETIALVDGWISEGDFLLAGIDVRFDVIVGNPPYIRIEQIAPELQVEYRRRFVSIYDRADLYVAFIEKSLTLLEPNGILSFICADRWILNRYGAPLRNIVTSNFHLTTYIDLHHASPFTSDVIAYPSIFVISPGATKAVNVFKISTADVMECEQVRRSLKENIEGRESENHSVYDSWFKGDEPWTLSSPDQLKILRLLEHKFHPIEDDGTTKIKIGVATGNDELYIVSKKAPIEKSRLLPLVMRADLQQGNVVNSGRFVINTFEDSDGVINLEHYPKLNAYLEKHADKILERHVAKKNARGWFRTIDRVYPKYVTKPKLLIPDIAGANEVTFDPGNYYPHHNLYYVVSETWDLEVLGGLLSSKIALFFVWSYAVKMRGGYLRFQAQYLRRIRVPNPTEMDGCLKKEIKDAFRSRDFKRLDRLSLRAYGLKQLPDFDFVDTRA